jgi:hydrogenase expression/formation protein HypE
MAVMIARGDLKLEADLESDTAPLHALVGALLELGEELRWLRDPTRGGLATALNELAYGAKVAVVLDEDALPIRPQVAGACEILGIDPLYVANEGKLVAVVSPDSADRAIDALRALPIGVDAVIVGTVAQEPEGLVLLETSLGGRRIVDMLVGDPLPRIC